MNELYEILYLLFDVEKGSSKDELKSAYRKIATQFHPDKNKEIDPNIFIALAKGYELLLEKSKDNESTPTKEKKDPFKDLTDRDFKDLAAQKIANSFRLLLSQNNPESLLKLNVIKHIKTIFNNETHSLNKSNAHIRKDTGLLETFKTRIKSKSDSLAIIEIVEGVIKEKFQLIKKNKNKIKINKEAYELIKEYTFETNGRSLL